MGPYEQKLQCENECQIIELSYTEWLHFCNGEFCYFDEICTICGGQYINLTIEQETNGK